MRLTLESYGGRLNVSLYTFLYEAEDRFIDRDVVMKNLVSRLLGTDPNDENNFIVSEHYDSCASEINDSTSAESGASDDASGTAAAMEMAHVLAADQFPVIRIIVGVLGEKQGLIGAK